MPPLARVAVAPIVGAPDAIAKQIQQEFTSAIEKQRVSVTASKEERADYTLRGYIVAAKDKTATKVSYIWDVTDPSGKRVNRITGEEVISANAIQGPLGRDNAAGRAVHRQQGCQFLRGLAAEPEQPGARQCGTAVERGRTADGSSTACRGSETCHRRQATAQRDGVGTARPDHG